MIKSNRMKCPDRIVSGNGILRLTTTRLSAIAACLISVFAGFSPSARSEPIDKRQLDEMRRSVESLMSRIRNLQMQYITDSEADQHDVLVSVERFDRQRNNREPERRK